MSNYLSNETTLSLDGVTYQIDSLAYSNGTYNRYLGSFEDTVTVADQMGDLETTIQRKVWIEEFFLSAKNSRDKKGGVTVPGSSESQFEKLKKVFFEQSKTLANISSPHLAKVREVTEANNTVYRISDYIEGGKTLESSTASSEMATLFSSNIGEALRSLNEHGILHGDIQPANIWIMPNGNLQLMGVSCSAEFNEGPYLSAEIKGSVPDPDVYGFGATLYFISTGKDPSSIELEMTSDSIRPIIAKSMGLGTDPYRSASELLDDLQVEATAVLESSELDETLQIESEKPVDEGGETIISEEQTKEDTVIFRSAEKVKKKKKFPVWLVLLVTLLVVSTFVGRSIFSLFASPDPTPDEEDAYDKYTEYEFILDDEALTLFLKVYPKGGYAGQIKMFKKGSDLISESVASDPSTYMRTIRESMANYDSLAATMDNYDSLVKANPNYKAMLESFSEEYKEELKEYNEEQLRAKEELAFFEEVFDSNSLSGYQEYIARYPYGIFVMYAQQKVEELSQ